jgi:hypothetical protein
MPYFIGVLVALGVAPFATSAGLDRDRTFYTTVTIVVASYYVLIGAPAGHGVFDALRGNVIDNPGVPAWWTAFCGAYDVVAGACFAWIIVRRSRAAAGPGHRA